MVTFVGQFGISDILVAGLIVVGLWYSWETRKLASDTKRNIRINFLQQVLEKFYTPLLKNPVFWKTNHPEICQFWNEAPSHESADGRLAKDFRDTVTKYSHLASKELEPALYQFEVIIRSGVENLEPKPNSTKDPYDAFKVEFNDALKRDYEKFVRDLSELVHLK